MANHKSAKKRARQTVKLNALNRAKRAEIRTLAKTSETVSASGDGVKALTALRMAESALAKGCARNLVHKKTAARKTSRLAKRAKAAAKKA